MRRENEWLLRMVAESDQTPAAAGGLLGLRASVRVWRHAGNAASVHALAEPGLVAFVRHGPQ